MSNRTRICVEILLIIILGFVVYANSLNGKFLWDDYSHVKDNIFIKHWSSLPKMFSQDMGAGAGYRAPFLRPLQAISYMIDYSFWGLNVKGYHLNNTLIHILVALSIYWLVSLLRHNHIAPFLTSTLFVVHPVCTEAVVFISDRADLLAALFVLLCLILYIKYIHSAKTKTYIFLLISYTLALLSKENSIILPVLLLLYHYTFEKKITIRYVIPIMIITFIYIFFRVTVLNLSLTDMPRFAILLQRIPGFFVAIIDYLRIMVLPFNLHIEYSYRLFYFTDPKAIWGMSVTVLLLIYALRKRKVDRLIFFSLLWFFITLLPVSNIYPINDSYMAERWLYLPSIGLFLLCADKLSYQFEIKKYRRFVIIFIIGMLALYSYLTIQQNEFWKEPISFYKRTLKYNPGSWRIYNELGTEYANMGNSAEAIAAYKKALEINPKASGIYDNLGVLYKKIGNREEAMAMYKKAKEINTKLSEQYREMAKEYSYSGKNAKAVLSYKKALELDRGNLALYNGLASMLIIVGKYREAIVVFKKALTLDPNSSVMHNNLALAYYYAKQYDLAVKHCDKALNLGYKVVPKLLELLKPYRR